MTVYDLHAHSTHSDGRATVEYLIQKAKEGNYKTGVSDHLFCDHNDTLEDISSYLDHVCTLGIPVGGEANIGEEFPIPDQMLQRFDYIIASVHAIFAREAPFRINRYFAMRSGFCDTWAGYNTARASEFLELAYKQMESHFSRYRVEILGHCCVMPFYDDIPYWSSEIIDWENAVVGLCKKYHVAMEITSMFCEPYERMLRAAKKAGVKFSFGSDCHKLEHVGNLKYSLEMADTLQLTDADLFLPSF